MTSVVLAGLLHREPFQAFHFVLGDNTAWRLVASPVLIEN
jgi:hypothetical protein